MITEKHDLIHDLPEHKESIHHLKTHDEHFRNRFDEYHELEHEVRRTEEGVEVHGDDHTAMRKRKLLALKDELLNMILAYEKQST